MKQLLSKLSASQVEVEQKYRVSNISPIRRALKKLRAKKGLSGREHNELYDLNRTLRRKRQMLRLRYHGKRNARLTFKGPRIEGHEFKKRIEIETSVNYEAMKRILNMLHFRVVSSYRKYREEYHLPHAKVCLDELQNLGWFVEIEGAPRTIRRVAEKLGLEDKHREERSYQKILRQKRKRLIVHPPN